MSVVLSLSYLEIVRSLQRAGFVVVRQRGSHIRSQKHTSEETLKITVQPDPLAETIQVRSLRRQWRGAWAQTA